MREKLVSDSIERACLSLLIKYDSCLHKFISILRSNHFGIDVNRLLFQAISDIHESGSSVNKEKLILKLDGASIKNISDVHIADYVEALSLFSIKEDCSEQYFKDLFSHFVARVSFDKCESLKKDLVSNRDKSPKFLAALAEKKFSDVLTTSYDDDDPTDLYKDIDLRFEEWMNEEYNFIPASLPIFADAFGDFYSPDLYVFASPFGVGKSTILNFFANSAIEKTDCRIMFLDTELTTREVQSRLLARSADVNSHYIERGKCKDDEDMMNRVRKVAKEIKKEEDKSYHEYVANKTIDEICAMMRRWHYKHCKGKGKEGKDIPCMIVYDYIKLTGETVTEVKKEYKVLGEKTDMLKKLAEELDCPILAAVQTNAEGNVAGSREICNFASNVFALEEKTIEDLNDHGDSYGTHKLTPVKARKWGERKSAFSKWVRESTDRGRTFYRQNYINLDIKNFNIKEAGTLEDVINGSIIAPDETSEPHEGMSDIFID